MIKVFSADDIRAEQLAVAIGNLLGGEERRMIERALYHFLADTCVHWNPDDPRNEAWLLFDCVMGRITALKQGAR